MQALGFDWRWRAPERLISLEDYRSAARRRLPSMVWTYVDGGADDLVTRDANRSAFARWSLVPRVLAGHETHDLSTTVAGIDVDMPVLLAPTGFSGLSYWKGDLSAARAAERRGTRYVLSTASSWAIEEVAAAASERDHVFQLYPGAEGLAGVLMDRAWSAGYRALMVTVDVPVKGNREGERKKGMAVPPVLTPARLANISRHPRWAYDIVRYRRVGGRNLVTGGGVAKAIESIETQERQLMQSRLHWRDIAWMRDRWKGRLYVKGVLHPEDAVRAVQLGLDGVVVSNHGGRQLDSAPATLDVLPSIVRAVGGRGEVLLDGGVRRGTDVIKALALGANAVLIGRPYVYALAVSGEAGVVHVLDILREEMERALTLMGVGTVRDVDHTCIAPAAGAWTSQAG